MLAAVDLDLMQSVSMAIGVQRQTEMNPITIVFAGINGHLPEVVDTLKEGFFTKMTPRAVFALSPGHARLPDGLKFVYAIVALLSEGKYDVIISAPNREIEMENLRPLRAEQPAGCGRISRTQ